MVVSVDVLLFFYSIINGLFCGTIKSVFNIVERKTPLIIKVITDFFLGLITGFVQFLLLFRLNFGKIAFFSIIGLVLGLFLAKIFFNPIFKNFVSFASKLKNKKSTKIVD